MSFADKIKDSIAGIIIILLLYGICTLGSAAHSYEPSMHNEVVYASNR